jgi:hypothetical protein
MKRMICALVLCWCAGSVIAAGETSWRDKFDVGPKDFVSTGKYPYFNLEPGDTLVLEGKEDGKTTVLTIAVLAETLTLDGVETRVVEERQTEDGQLVELARNYFAASKATGDVFYFGEDVDTYRDGKLTGHGGSWRSGVNGAKFGLMIPAKPKVGDRYYQELAGEVARDRAEIINVTTTVKTPAGTFTDCVKTEETTPLEKGTKEYKLYAPGIGIVQDGDLRLKQHRAPGK